MLRNKLEARNSAGAAAEEHGIEACSKRKPIKEANAKQALALVFGDAREREMAVGPAAGWR
jgi:hypothetical protein